MAVSNTIQVFIKCFIISSYKAANTSNDSRNFIRLKQ